MGETVQCDAVPDPCVLTTVGEELTVDYTQQTVGAMLIRTWYAEDVAGNSVTHTQTITVEDTIAPVLSRQPSDETVSCNCDTFPPPATVVALDNCDDDVAISFVEEKIPTDSADEYTLVRTWTATDDAGNSVSHSQSIVVEDEQSPTLYPAPSDSDASCDAVAGPSTVRALDNCDDSVTVSYTQTSTGGACDHSYTLIRSWSATDRSGNNAEHTQTVAVADSTPPEINQIGDACVWPADETKFSTFLFVDMFSTHDNCASSVPVTFVGRNSTSVNAECHGTPDGVKVRAAPGSTYDVYVSATDACSNDINTKATISVPASAQEHALSGDVCNGLD